MKTRKRYMLLVQALVIVIIFSFILFYNLNRPRVMVLHSYDNDQLETIAFNKGFDLIQHNIKNPYVVHSYMNIDPNDSAKDRVRAGDSARQFIEEFSPEIIVAVGEEAQEYATKHYINQPDIQIIFACIRDAESYDYARGKNVTGIIDELPLEEIKELLQKNLLTEEPLRLIILGDQSFRMTIEQKYLSQKDWSPFILSSPQQVETFEGWKKAIKKENAKPGRGVILLSNYHTLRKSEEDTHMVSPADVIHWTKKNSRHPILGIYESNFLDGAPLCISSSAEESGAKVARYIQRIIDGEKPSELPQEKTQQFIVGIGKKAAPRQLHPTKAHEIIARSHKRFQED